MSSVAAGLQNASRTLLTASGDGAEQSEKPRTCTHRELSPHCLWGQEVAGGGRSRGAASCLLSGSCWASFCRSPCLPCGGGFLREEGVGMPMRLQGLEPEHLKDTRTQECEYAALWVRPDSSYSDKDIMGCEDPNALESFSKRSAMHLSKPFGCCSPIFFSRPHRLECFPHAFASSYREIRF